MIVTLRLAAVLAHHRPGLTFLDGHPVWLLALPTALPGSPLRSRFECPSCGRKCTLLRRSEEASGGWRCRLCLPVPRERRRAAADRVRAAENALEALRRTPAERQHYERWRAWRARLDAERAALALLLAEARPLAASFRRPGGV